MFNLQAIWYDHRQQQQSTCDFVQWNHVIIISWLPKGEGGRGGMQEGYFIFQTIFKLNNKITNFHIIAVTIIIAVEFTNQYKKLQYTQSSISKQTKNNKIFKSQMACAWDIVRQCGYATCTKDCGSNDVFCTLAFYTAYYHDSNVGRYLLAPHGTTCTPILANPPCRYEWQLLALSIDQFEHAKDGNLFLTGLFGAPLPACHPPIRPFGAPITQ